MYTTVREYNGNIYFTAYIKGKRTQGKVGNFRPHLYVPTTEETPLKTYPLGERVKKMPVASLKDYHGKTKEYPDGFLKCRIRDLPLLQFIRETKLYEGYDPANLKIFWFDIEVLCERGFPDPQTADAPITSIAGKLNGGNVYHVWYLSNESFTFSKDSWFFHHYPELEKCGSLDKVAPLVQKFKEQFIQKLEDTRADLLKQRAEKIEEYEKSPELQLNFDEFTDYVEDINQKIENIVKHIRRINNVEKRLDMAVNMDLRKFKTVTELLLDFNSFLGGNEIDVISGWNSEKFDLPYIINASKKLTGSAYKNISPFKIVPERKLFDKGEQTGVSYSILGIEHFDLMRLDQHYRQNKRDSDKLEDVAQFETGEGKVEYNGDLNELWKNDRQLYITYNIGDVDCLENIHNRLGYINLLYGISHYTRGIPESYNQTTAVWHAHLYNKLLEKNLVLSRYTDVEKRKYDGAYVYFEGKTIRKWIVSFDLTSLYSSIIRMMNISHEMLRGNNNRAHLVEDFVKGEFNFSNHKGVSLCPNGVCFDNSKQGIIPAIIEELFIQRKAHKKQSFLKAQEAKAESDLQRREELERESGILDITQYAEKIMLNSFYGATATDAFLLFFPEYPEAITTMGQVANRYCSTRINKWFCEYLGIPEKNFIIYQHTDSFYINFDDFVETLGDKTDTEIVDIIDDFCKKKVEPKIAEIYKEMAEYMGVFENTMEMKREVIAKGAYWTGATTYAMLVWDSEGKRFETPKEKIMGIKIVRSDTPASVKPFLKKFVRKMLLGKDLFMFIEETKQEVLSWGADRLFKPSSVKVLDNYVNDDAEDIDDMAKKGSSAHIKGTINYNYLLDRMNLKDKYEMIHAGDKVRLVYLKAENPYGFESICYKTELPEEFELGEYIDSFKMYHAVMGKFIDDTLVHTGLKGSVGNDFDLF